MKTRKIRYLLLYGLLCISIGMQAQQVTLLVPWQEELEQLGMNGEEETDADWQDELEELARRMEEPLDLNTATRKQLEQFFFLTDKQIENLLAYVYLHGPMQTVSELQMVEEMDRESINRLLPLVCVKPVQKGGGVPGFKQVMKYGRHEWLTRLDIPLYIRKGYEKSYLGPSLYHSLRYRFRYGDRFQVGVTAEKDAGEPMFALHNRKGYDWYSPFLLLKEMGWLKALALGHYRMSFGQGLVLGNNFLFGKSFSLATTEQRTEGIRAHTSTDEYNYFRGVAATLQPIRSVNLTLFYSHRSLDGVVQQDTITSIYKTGLHRSQAEADKRETCVMQAAGGRLAFQKQGIRLGVTALGYGFNHPYSPNYRNYARYSIQGDRFYNVGMDYSYRSAHFSWTGEMAKGKQGYALLNQLGYRFSPDYRLLLIHRYYTHDYWAFFAHSFSEGSAPQNENGWYLAAEASPWAAWRLFASVDLFSFPWWKYRISRPSQGVDVRFQATYRPYDDMEMYLNYVYKRKERDVTQTGGEVTLPIYHHRLRYRLSLSAGEFALRTTADFNHFRQQDGGGYRFTPQIGWAVTQLCEYAPSRFPLSVSLQGSYFQTDDYDARVYIAERGLLYTFYVPSFSGRGWRYSAEARYEWKKRVMLLAKFGQTIYLDRTSIGTGNDKISGNRKGDVQLQLRLKL
ncbi:MAG: helix-hairpin-helix domain-containing protein [Bacteroides sp.]